MTLPNGVSLPGWIVATLATAITGSAGFAVNTLFKHEARIATVEERDKEISEQLTRIEQKVDGLYVARNTQQQARH